MFIPISNELPIGKVPKVTFALIGINISVYILSSSLVGRGLLEFMIFFGVVPALATSAKTGIWYKTFPFLTYMFIHGSLLHLIGNMVFLFIFGANVENKIGGRRYLYFYIIGGIVAVLFQVISKPHVFAINIGASGAVSCIMGAFLVLFPKAKIRTLFILKLPLPVYLRLVDIPAYIYLGITFIIQIIYGIVMISSRIAHWSHIGGFIAGIAGGIVIPRLFIRLNDQDQSKGQVRIITPRKKQPQKDGGYIFRKILELLDNRILDIPVYIYAISLILQYVIISMISSSVITNVNHLIFITAFIICVVLVLIYVDYNRNYGIPKTKIKIIPHKKAEIKSFEP